MAKCHENRIRRQKRCLKNRREKLRAFLYEKIPLHKGSRPYYEPHNIVVKGYKLRRMHGKLYFCRIRARYMERPTAKYHETIQKLIEMCGDVTIDLSEIRGKSCDVASE